MLLFPAIDLKDGKCVRLLRGDMATATVFNDSPAAQAKAFANAGCEWLHLVDLNGAVEGHPVNRAAVQSILKEVEGPGPARRRHPHHREHRAVDRGRRQAGHPGHRRGARSRGW